MMKGNKYHVLGDTQGNIMYKYCNKWLFYYYFFKEFSIKTGQ